MPLYYFDIANNNREFDDVGTECVDDAEVSRQAMRALPDIARDEMLNDGDRRTFSVVARDERGEAVYAASLSYTGLWLRRRP